MTAQRVSRKSTKKYDHFVRLEIKSLEVCSFKKVFEKKKEEQNGMKN